VRHGRHCEWSRLWGVSIDRLLVTPFSQSRRVYDIWGQVWASDKGVRGVLLQARPCLQSDKSQVVLLMPPRLGLL
jgi:hypothetical protein